MSLHRLEVEARDVRAGALGLVLDAPAPAALAETSLHDGTGGGLTLGVIGASHVVTASVGGRRLTEEVSCDAVTAGGSPLPSHVDRDGYELVSECTEMSRAALDELAVELRRRAATDEAFLCATFPGADAAVTALTAAPGDGSGWTWQSWHLYPDEGKGPDRGKGTVVTTRSRWNP